MFDTEQEHRDFHYASDAEWDRTGAYEVGAAHPERAWIASDRDSWYANPYYVGPPVRHPEDDDYEDTGLAPVDLDDMPF